MRKKMTEEEEIINGEVLLNFNKENENITDYIPIFFIKEICNGLKKDKSPKSEKGRNEKVDGDGIYRFNEEELKERRRKNDG